MIYRITSLIFFFFLTIFVKAQKQESIALSHEVLLHNREDEWLLSSVSTFEGGVIGCGAIKSIQAGKGLDAYFLSINKNGKVNWRHSFGGSYNDVATTVNILNNGQIIIGGLSHKSKSILPIHEHTTSWIKCKNNFGDETIWEKTWDKEKASPKIFSILISTFNGNIYTIGSQNERLWITCMDDKGNTIFDNVYSKNFKDLNIINLKGVVDQEGNLICLGTAELYPSDKKIPILTKITPDGEIVFSEKYPDENIVDIGSIVQVSENQVAISFTLSKNKGEFFYGLININSPKKYVQSKDFGTDYGIDEAKDLIKLDENKILYLGQTTSQKRGAIKKDLFIKLMNTKGEYLSNVSPFYGDKLEDLGERLLYGNDGKIWICGSKDNGNSLYSNYDFYFAETNSLTEEKPKSQKLNIFMQDSSYTELRLKNKEEGYFYIIVENKEAEKVQNLKIKTECSGSNDISFPDIHLINAIEPGKKQTIPLRFVIGKNQKPSVINIKSTIVINNEILGEKNFKINVEEKESTNIDMVSYNCMNTLGDEPRVGDEIKLTVLLTNKGSQLLKNIHYKWKSQDDVSLLNEIEGDIADIMTGASKAVTLSAKTTSTSNEVLSFNLILTDNDNFIKVIPVSCTLQKAKPIQPIVEIKQDEQRPRANEVQEAKPSTGKVKVELYVSWLDANVVVNHFKQEYEVSAIAHSSQKLNVEDFRVVINGDTISYKGTKMGETDLIVEEEKSGEYETRFISKINLAPGKNKVNVLATLGDLTKSTKDKSIQYTPQDKGKLYILSIGVPDQTGRLKYTQKDALDFAQIFKSQDKNFFGDLDITTLTAFDSTKTEIIEKKITEYSRRTLANANPEKDVFMMFISSHGFEDNNKFKIQASNFNEDSKRSTSLDFQEDILAKLEEINCKKFVFIDACKSGSIAEDYIGRKDVDFSYSTALEKLSKASNNTRIIASCSSKEFSFEDESWQNGAFTKGLKDLLQNNTDMISLDINHDNALSMKEILPNLRKKVAIMVMDKKGKYQTPSMPSGQENEDVPIFGVKF